MSAQYLSEFEILSESIVPAQANIPPSIPLPFVNQGYFVLVTRLPDDIVGDLMIKLTFNPSFGFPAAANFLFVDYQDENGNTQLTALDASNSATFAIGSGKTVLFGIQPDTANLAANGPLGTGAFGARGYVTIDADAGTKPGTFQLAVVPEIRASFFTVAFDPTSGKPPVPDFTGASEVAYTLPTASSTLVTLTKVKEVKDGKDSKDGNKDKELHKDAKDAIDGSKRRVRDYPQIISALGAQSESALADLSDRLAAIEALVGTGQAFITPPQRPTVG